MIQLLKRLFGAPAAEAAVEPPTERVSAAAAVAAAGPVDSVDAEGIEGFVSYVVRSLVDSPEQVRISTADGERGTVITVSCEKKDIGKIIGKNGKTIAAIRALANGAGGRLGKRVSVEVQD